MRALLTLLVFVGMAFGQIPLESFYDGYKGTMVIYVQQEQNFIIVNESRAATRYTPWSTFKIPNSIIALETGVVGDVEEVVKWDEEKYPAEDWWPDTWKGDQNLRSGLQYSVVPLYRTLANRIGETDMQRYINAFNYGNRDITSGIDNFWLNGSIQISAMEQIAFLRKFYNDQLDISPETSAAVKDILLREKTETYRLSHKTGAGTIDRENKIALGWLVGYVEKGDGVTFFASNLEGQGFDTILKPRVEIPLAILRELGIID